MKLMRFLRFRVLVAAAVIYLGLLVVLAGYGAVVYRNLYTPPSIDRELHEDTVLQLWDQGYAATYAGYGSFLRAAGLFLAVCLAVVSAGFGIGRRSRWQGLLALGSGLALSTLFFMALPWIYFPFDQYSAAIVWVMAAGPLAVLIWLVLIMAGLWSQRGGTSGLGETSGKEVQGRKSIIENG